MMAEKDLLLILRLEGPLQAWGEDSKWDYRGTASIPTKSGIMGLLGCAMGLERGSAALAELSRAVRIAIRADRAGTGAVDFHTVTGDPLRNAVGKPKSGGNTIITPRVYLQDACFTVFLETDEAWHSRICAALGSPAWCMYLGRKSCVPSVPILPCAHPAYASLEEAVQSYPPAPRHDPEMTVEWDEEGHSPVSLLRPDEKCAGDRQFTMRRVWRGTVKEADHVSDPS